MFEVIETSLEHPNLEVLQIADRVKREDGFEEEPPKGGRRAPVNNDRNQSKISICKGI